MTLSDDVRRAYDDAGLAWSQGPARVYRALAQPVLEVAGDVSDALVLDVGTGTGVLADALVRRRARVVGLDFSHGMLRHRSVERPPAVVADVRAMPVRSSEADLVTASFVLNHLDDPVMALRELRRVLRPGGRLLATTFEGEAPHPAKALMDAVASSYGWVAPDWYRVLKHARMPLLGTPARLTAAGRAADFREIRVERVPIVLALSPAELVGWRFGMAHLAPFVAELAEPCRASLLREAEQAAAAVAEPVEMGVLLLAARA